ncbi:MAG: ATP-binding cassette domain-containing protein [Proteobacteria bacterium]|nr:ATP-binding cassette domain-containing protein [Pseudomonadota bacterium]
MTAAPTWDIAARRTLHRRGASFELDVAFRSSASRIVLFGPSGAGKTQTLRMISGTADPDRGHIAIGGRALFDSTRSIRLTPQQRNLGYVYQDYALFPHLTVRQNIAFSRVSGWRNPPRDARDDVVERWLATLGLEPVAHAYPEQLSGGQRQRTALARALAAEPVALLLDEPFAALDQRLRARLRDDLVALQATLDLPMLLITHDDDDVAALAQEVVYVEHGRVVAELGQLA